MMKRAWLVFAVFSMAAFGAKRARDYGVPFDGEPGALNAITDVKGVEVGMVTLQSRKPGKDGKTVFVNTGVTTIFPAGKIEHGVPGAWFSLNGNGEMTGTAWLDEAGFLEGPIVFTNTHSVGVARDAVVAWGVKRWPKTETYSLPVVGETWDGELNDINGFHVTKQDVLKALDAAKTGPVAEGNVGGGTGMILFEYKGGTGTSSRKVGDYTVGVLVQANFGNREDMRLAGVPLGTELTKEARQRPDKKDGSILVAVATDAPLLPHQLKRLARRASLALGRTGSISRNSSGDLFVAFSTARPQRSGGLEHWTSVPNSKLDSFFKGTIDATEEAIANVLFAAKREEGPKGVVVEEMPVDRVLALLKKYGRLKDSDAR